MTPALSAIGARPVRNRQRPPVELSAEGESDVGLVHRRVGGLRLGDYAIESGGIASRQRRPAEVHRPCAGEALDQRRGTAPGRGEIERSPEAARESGPFDRDRVDSSARRSASPRRRRAGASHGRRRRLARSASVRSSRSSRPLSRRSMAANPCAESASVRSSVPTLSLTAVDGGRSGAGANFASDQRAPALPGWGGPSASARMSPIGSRSTASSPWISAGGDDGDRAAPAPAPSASSAPEIAALASGGRSERRDRLIGQLAAGLDPGNRRRELRERPLDRRARSHRNLYRQVRMRRRRRAQDRARPRPGQGSAS